MLLDMLDRLSVESEIDCEIARLADIGRELEKRQQRQ